MLYLQEQLDRAVSCTAAVDEALRSTVMAASWKPGFMNNELREAAKLLRETRPELSEPVLKVIRPVKLDEALAKAKSLL